MSKVFCLDLELNQPSGKIIQIGYVIGCLLTNRIFTKKSLIINPKEELGMVQTPNGEVHICEFTGLSKESIESGMSLPEAYQIILDDLKQYNPTRTCVQWGDGSGDHKGDHDAIRRELGLSWSDFAFRARTWDTKMMYQIYRAFRNKSVASGLSAALKDLGLEFQGRPHDALDDAYNTFIAFTTIGQKFKQLEDVKKLLK